MKNIKLDILAFGAHPDDVELGCGGTILKEISNGKKVGIIDLTGGELGTRGNAEIRNSESETAAKILGVTLRDNLNFKDGFFLNDQEHQLKVIECIRKYKPEIVIPTRTMSYDSSETNVRVLSSWQWEISNSPSIADSNGIVEYQDCMLRDGASLRAAFDGYKNFASMSQEAGSSMGMKMIFNESGSEGDSDYVFTIWNSSISKYGSDLDTYVNELNGTPWNKNHGDWAICKNSRTFTSIPIMIP